MESEKVGFVTHLDGEALFTGGEGGWLISVLPPMVAGPELPGGSEVV